MVIKVKNKSSLFCNIGITFLEIMVAMAILITAMLPVFTFIHKGAEDTDANAAQAFALTKATEILNMLLDNVPFEALRQGTPALLKTSDICHLREYQNYNDNWAREMANILFPECEQISGGYLCKGTHKDARGISYLAILKVEDVTASLGSPNEKPEKIRIGSSYPDSPPVEFPDHPKGDLTFAFLMNPTKILSSNWFYKDYDQNPLGSRDKPRWELDLPNGVSESPINIYKEDDYINPYAIRYTQRMAADKVNYTNDPRYQYCTMKKLIIEIKYNIEKQYFTKPDVESKGTRRIHLMTIKGDIQR